MYARVLFKLFQGRFLRCEKNIYEMNEIMLLDLCGQWIFPLKHLRQGGDWYFSGIWDCLVPVFWVLLGMGGIGKVQGREPDNLVSFFLGFLPTTPYIHHL